MQHLICTSVATDRDHLGFALAHRWTDRRIQGYALRWTILRHGLYAEFFGSLLAPAEGVITAPFGSGAAAVVTRADLAEAAANVASDPDRHINRVYNLVGPRDVTADQIARAAGLVYKPASLGRYRALLLTRADCGPSNRRCSYRSTRARRTVFSLARAPTLEVSSAVARATPNTPSCAGWNSRLLFDAQCVPLRVPLTG
ncbi:hypothetical protein SAMN05216274_11848 [Cryobacterium levicorallinum]|uniref:NmrA-like family protein n=1 Tax=Cryobacterium levicorallinum TaxID=995038 RepID=A0ABY1EHE6_9MICO|nr:hypothetical protein SAMN05216274_11848 [Cryobacterium levicorallinum]